MVDVTVIRLTGYIMWSGALLIRRMAILPAGGDSLPKQK
jgi:hypothetical protein